MKVDGVGYSIDLVTTLCLLMNLGWVRVEKEEGGG